MAKSFVPVESETRLSHVAKPDEPELFVQVSAFAIPTEKIKKAVTKHTPDMYLFIKILYKFLPLGARL